MDMGQQRRESLPNTQNPCNTGTSTRTPQFNRSIRAGSRRLGLRSRSSTPPKEEGRKATPAWILFSHSERSRTELRHLRPRTTGNRKSPETLATIPGRLTPQDQNLLRSPQPDALEVASK